MSLTKTVGLFAGTTLAITGAAFGSTEANNSAQQQQINDLYKEIAELKAKNGQDWLTEQRATEIKGLVQDVLADADTRASLQGAGATAGWDNGFFLASADGNFRLNISGGAQLRWTLNHREDQNQYEQTTNWGFQSRMAQMTFSGHIVDPSWQYLLNINIADDAEVGTGNGTPYTAGTAYLRDWWVLKDFGGWYIKAGQFTAPFSRERLLSDFSRQFIDRSNTAYVFGLGRTQGVEAGFLTDVFRAAIAYSDAVGPVGPSFNNGYLPYTPAPINDFAFSGRAEFKFGGTWRQFEDEQSWRGEEFGFLLGGGAYYTQGRNNYVLGESGGGEQYGVTIDATVDFGGANITGAFYYTGQNDYLAPNSGDDNTWGFSIQGGFFLTDDFELVARYEYGDLDGAVPVDEQSTITVGGNYYFARNRAKWQADVSYAFDPMGAFAVPGNGWYQDLPDSDGQWVFRTGVTVSF